MQTDFLKYFDKILLFCSFSDSRKLVYAQIVISKDPSQNTIHDSLNEIQFRPFLFNFLVCYEAVTQCGGTS